MLELVLEEQSLSRVLRQMSTGPEGPTGTSGDGAGGRIQGWSQICSRVGRSEGRSARHHLMSCWQSEEEEEEEEEGELKLVIIVHHHQPSRLTTM